MHHIVHIVCQGIAGTRVACEGSGDFRGSFISRGSGTGLPWFVWRLQHLSSLALNEAKTHPEAREESLIFWEYLWAASLSEGGFWNPAFGVQTLL